MIRGAQKQMIVLKTADSQVFEEAYFVLRRGAVGERMDMLAEANRIVDGCGIGKKRKKQISVKSLVFMLCSFVAGGAVGAIIVGALTFAA